MTRLGSIRQTWLCRVLAQHPLVPFQSLHVNSDPYYSVILAHVSSFTGHSASRTHTRKCTRVHTHALRSLMLTFLIHTPMHTLISLPLTSSPLPIPPPSTCPIVLLALWLSGTSLKGTFPDSLRLSGPLVRSLFIRHTPLCSLNHTASVTDVLKAEVVLSIPRCPLTKHSSQYRAGISCTLFEIGQMNCPGSPRKSSEKLGREPRPSESWCVSSFP